MKTKAGIAGHPLHPMLVVFPIGLWVFSFAADLIYTGTHNTAWVAVAYYAIAGGIIGALAAAVPGAIDLFSITRGQTRRTGTWHMLINLTVLVLFAINLWLRSYTREVTSGLIWLSGISVACLPCLDGLAARWSIVRAWRLRKRNSNRREALLTPIGLNVGRLDVGCLAARDVTHASLRYRVAGEMQTVHYEVIPR